MKCRASERRAELVRAMPSAADIMQIINFVRMNTEQDIQLLISAIENAEGISKITSKKFEHLSQRIFMRTRERIGVTTLKRLWGYVNDTTTPRAVTLDI